ncbi:hypothetical protein ACGFZP_13180 [Kitasatospora sp. NPDC048239]|uniref:hypothetical protein n=1 Tax=Kitasatospora sp. NPDC048239 TaxID=3364046 RepID=UPI003719A571
MSHRPYPSTDRTLRQLGRHHHPAPNPTPLQLVAAKALRDLAAAMEPLRQASLQFAPVLPDVFPR